MVVAFRMLGDPGIAAGLMRAQQLLGNRLVVVTGQRMEAACLRMCRQARQGTLAVRTLAPWSSGSHLGQWEQSRRRKLRQHGTQYNRYC